MILGAFAHQSLHCDNVLSPEAIVTLCPFMGQRQTCDFWLFPKAMGRQNLGWGLPPWVGTAVGGPQGFTGTPQGGFPTPRRGSCPPGQEDFLLYPSHCGGPASSVGCVPAHLASLGGTGKLCPLCARQRDRVSHVVSLPSIPAVAESSRAEQTLECHGVCPVGVPLLSPVCRRCYHKTKSSLWCVTWPNPDCCKIN